jgi:hypothetical protein
LSRHVTLVLAIAIAACSGRVEPRGGDSPTPGHGPRDVVPTTTAPAGACDDAPLVTIDQIAAGEHAGERVAIDLVPQTDMACTELLCTAPGGRNPECCNRCNGSYGVSRNATDATGIRIELGIGSCVGMDCNFTCEPFGWAPTHRYRFVGKNVFSPPGTSAVYARSQLRVERYCAVAPS